MISRLSDPVDIEPLPHSEKSQLAAYEPRSFSFLGITKRGNFRIKLYGIRSSVEPLDQAMVTVAKAHVLEHLPDFAEAEGDHHGLGFAILHKGKITNWLLMHWWAHADILCQRMAHTNAEGSFVGTARPFHGCVWEGVVIAREHRAWIDTMLTHQPDPEAYLHTVLADGSY